MRSVSGDELYSQYRRLKCGEMQVIELSQGCRRSQPIRIFSLSHFDALPWKTWVNTQYPIDAIKLACRPHVSPFLCLPLVNSIAKGMDAYQKHLERQLQQQQHQLRVPGNDPGGSRIPL